MVFLWILSDSKSHQVSRTLLSILAVLNNVVVWVVSTRPLISKPSSLLNNLLVTVLKAPITIGINVTFMPQSFFNSLARSRYLSFFSFSFNYILWSAWTTKFHNSLFLMMIIRSGRLAEIRWSVCMSKSHRLLLLLLFTPQEFFSGVWVTASLLKSPGLVSGFWPFLAMLSFG